LSLEGIGAKLQYDDGLTKVTELVPGGAADKDGRLKPGDHVLAVGQGREGEMVDVEDMNINEVVKLIRGKAGTVVRLKVKPADKGEPKVIDITRASIELKDSEARAEVIDLSEPVADKDSKDSDGKEKNVSQARAQILEHSRKPDGTPYKIGVIDLPSFYMDMKGSRLGLEDYKSTTRDMERILRDFKAKGVDAVILDLRRNGGGALNEAISTTGLFIDEGPVVQVKDSNGRVQQLDDPDKGVAWDGPLVVLQSKFSASASEIFAGAIQDYGRGLILGDRTSHGKGTVQSMIYLGQELFSGLSNAPPLGALKITIQQFYRPDGDSTQNRGVVSDVELPSITSHLDVGESDLDYALKFDRVNSAPYAKVNLVDKRMVDELRARSAQRVAQSDDFQKVEKKISRYKQLKEEKNVTLNESKFMAERADFNSDKEEEKQLEQLEDSNRPVVKRDYYFNEALAVTLDYLQLLHGAALNGVASGARAAMSGVDSSR
jgi:carboxyl-terminal processing protease